MISQKAKYALRALVALGRAPRYGSKMISEIAEEQAIPKKFLEQILLDLKRHGIVQSRRGKFGGYQLLKAPEDITFGHVLRIVDGPIALLPCLSKIAYRRCDDCATEISRVEGSGGRVERDKFSIGEYGFIALAWDTEGNMFGLHSMQ